MPSKLESALAYAAMGIRVFPCSPNAKTPAIDDWPNAATTDESRIRAWWGTGAPDWNIGVATGHGVFAIDADTKNGADGLDSLSALDLEFDLPTSFRTRTPSGGCHVLLKADTEIHNRARSVVGYPGIDIRGERGYVLGAGSTLENGAYEILTAKPIAPAGPDFLELLKKRPKHKKHTEQPIVKLDLDASTAKAIDWLEHFAPDAIEGEGGDDATYRTAAMLRDFGLSEAHALDLLFEHWNERQQPPWSPEDLEAKVANAYAYASGTWGGKTASADFDEVEIDDTPPPESRPVSPQVQRATDAAKRRSRFQVFSAAQSHEKAINTVYEPLVKNVLNQNTFATMIGRPGAAKTFNAIYLSLSIASGQPWAGKHETTQGAVFYIASEGGTGIHKRIAAAMQAKSLPADTPFFVLPATVDLLSSKDDAKAIAKLAKDTAAAAGHPLRLIVIDTLARSMGGGDENSAQDMGKFVQGVDYLRDATGATTLVIHHTGKDETKGARGSSALLGAIDTELTVTSEGKIHATKQRDLPESEVAAFRLVDHTVGTDPAGHAISTAIVSYGEAQTEFDDMPEDDEELILRQAIAAVTAASREKGWHGWFTRAECQAEFDRAAIAKESTHLTPVGAHTIQRRLKDMVRRKQVKVSGKGAGAGVRYRSLLADMQERTADGEMDYFDAES